MSWCRLGVAVAATCGAAGAFLAFGLSSGLQLVLSSSYPVKPHVATHAGVGGDDISVAPVASQREQTAFEEKGKPEQTHVKQIQQTRTERPQQNKRSNSNGGVVIVQAKNAAPLEEDENSFSKMKASWLQNVALAKLYAERHGYVHTLYFFGSDFSRACYRSAAETWIRAPWCKVLAVMDAMAEYPDHEYFLWIDTDVWLQRPGLKLHDFLKKVRVGDKILCRAKRETVVNSNASVFLWMNARNFFPWNCYPHTGIWLVRRSDLAQEVLLHWWSLAGLNFSKGIHIQGPCEQGPFVSLVMKKHKEDAVKVQDDPFTPHAPRQRGIAPPKDQFFIHRCRKCIWMIDPVAVLQGIMKENHIDFARMWKAVANLTPRRISEDGDILKRLDTNNGMTLSQSGNFSVLYDKAAALSQSPKLSQDFDDEHCSGQAFSKHNIRP